MPSYYIVHKDGDKSEIIPVKVLKNPEEARHALQSLRWKILMELAANPTYARDLAERLGVEEQKVYYHIHVLERLGLVRVQRVEERKGAVAKHYVADNAALAVVPDQVLGRAEAKLLQIALSEESSRFLEPFVTSYGVNATFVVGSPDSHGEFKARARCGHYAVDLASFLGSLAPLSRELLTRLDTEIAENELQGNLIVVGGPRVNTVAAKFNEKLPIRFDVAQQNKMTSTISGRMYYEEEHGVVEKIVNPLNPQSSVLVLAGNSHQGTRAAVTAFIKHIEEVAKGNTLNPSVLARVVAGLDIDSDGIIDEAEFLE